MMRRAAQALAEGIPVGLGTDSFCPYVTQYDMWRELAYFSKYVGVTPAFALHTATQVNAGLLGLSDVCGTVAAGMDADLVLTRDNPLEDLCALREPLHVLARASTFSPFRYVFMSDKLQGFRRPGAVVG